VTPATDTSSTPDAVIVGAGHNGLVAANVLADAGWDVCVVEAQPEPGGAVRSADYLGFGAIADVCSAFYPLGAASPAFRSLNLEDHGLRWRHAPSVLAHPLPDGSCPVLSRDLDATLELLRRLEPADAEAWRRLVDLWNEVGDDLRSAVFAPFPPVWRGARLLAKLRAAGLPRLARFTLLPLRRLIEEEFPGPAGMLIAGCSLHADMSPEATGSAVFGWLLAMLGHDVGFPVPEGGAGQITAALARRLESRGGVVLCDAPVRSIDVRHGRATGVRTADGRQISARRAVLADVAAPHLYGQLVDWDHLPTGMQDDIRRFQWDYATVKVDWLIRDGIPWTASEAAGAGTLHIADSLDELTEMSAHLATQRIPARPFLIAGQMTTCDPSRSPAGTEVVWAYTHVPRTTKGDAGGEGITGRWDDEDKERMRRRIEDRLEERAPGFRDRMISYQVTGPLDFQAHNSNLNFGAIQGGTMQPHQQLFLRPVPGLGRPQTPVTGLYLAGSSAHPGGGVHGACGSNAARAALRDNGPTRRLWAGAATAVTRR
jgi:phytoene dehydrogenase-like protein